MGEGHRVGAGRRGSRAAGLRRPRDPRVRPPAGRRCCSLAGSPAPVPSAQRPGASGADRGLAGGPRPWGGWARPWHPPQSCPHPLRPGKPPRPPGSRQAGSPPPPARWEAGARERPCAGRPGGPAHKSPARSPGSSPSFSILPRSQVELGGLKRRVNEASVQNDSFLNQAACSVLGK